MEERPGRVTVLSGGTVLAYNGRSHVILSHGDVAWRDDAILYVGPEWVGEDAERIDATGRLVVPGMVSTHSEIPVVRWTDASSPTRPRAAPRHGISGMEVEPTGLERAERGQRVDHETLALKWAMGRCLKSGVTTMLERGDHGMPPQIVAAVADRLGIRLYHGPLLDGVVETRACDETSLANELGPALDRLCEFIAWCDTLSNGRIRGILSVGRSLSLTGPSARALEAASHALNVPVSIGVAGTAWEFHERVRSSAATPIEWLSRHGLLGPQTLLTDCRYLAGMYGTAYPNLTDLPLIAAERSNICLTPLRDALLGKPSEHSESFIRLGINVSVGVGLPTFDVFEELRALTLTTKVASGNQAAGTSRSALLAATLHGAMALGREDLGRIASGAQADMAVIDMRRLRIGPYCDPVRAIVSSADAELVDDVIVAGRFVVRSGRVLAWDMDQVAAAMRSSSRAAGCEPSRIH